MPINFNPPPLPTPDRALAAAPEAADDAANGSVDLFATVLAAATDGAVPDESILLRTATTRANAAEGVREGSKPATPREDSLPADGSALVAALQALLTAPPPPPQSTNAALPGKADGLLQPRVGTRAIVPMRNDVGADVRAAGDPGTHTGRDSSTGVPSLAVAQEPANLGAPSARDDSAVGQGDRMPAMPAAAATTPRPAAADPKPDAALLAAMRDVVDTATAARPPHRGESMEPATANMTPAPAPAPLARIVIESPALTPAWRHEVVQEMTQMVVLRQDRAELHLNPPNLGPVSVHVTMDAGQANLLVTAAQPATRDALELALPQLRDSLAEQGITLGQANVQDDRPRPAFDGAALDSGIPERQGDPNGEPRAVSLPVATRRATGLIDLFA